MDQNAIQSIRLSGGAIDVLHQLAKLPKADGYVASKVGRDELVQKGLAFRVNGYNFISLEGARLFDAIHGLHRVIPS